MPGPSDEEGRREGGLDSLRERLLGVEERASVKSWFPRLRETVARLAESESRLRKLNEELEAEVAARTEELRRANAELGLKNGRLESTLAELEASREALLRSERIAASAAIAGSIAHELNSPLGALISSTAILGELAQSAARGLAAAPAELEPRELETFRILLEAGAARALGAPERLARLEDRLLLEEAIRRRGGSPGGTNVEDLLDLGIGPESPLLEPALASPKAAAGACLVVEALSAAATARRAGEQAAEVVRRLQRSVERGFEGGD
ncbi:MAG TPA: hypothetical protein PLB91_02690 [Spirochaetales bacterium]|nr:hypothetical protein [Spirochaetales bacterium]HRY54514.1 hypothetical protein [Spirochaetia bacterium]HRZ65878.1 hypothetical protein [Spirochaetia bacterium]